MDLNTTIKVARGFGLIYFLSFWLSLVFGIANGFFGVLPKFDKFALIIVVFVISSPALFLSMICYAISHHLQLSRRIANNVGSHEEIEHEEIIDPDDTDDTEQARRLASIRRKARANAKHPSF